MIGWDHDLLCILMALSIDVVPRVHENKKKHTQNLGANNKKKIERVMK